MRTKVLSLVLLVVLAAGLVALLPAMAQDDMMTHTCDSTTILLLYIAEHDYGYQPMMDMSTFDKGQYAPLFDAMMAAMESGDMMTEEPMMGDEMATEEPMMGDEMGDMTMLMPLTVPDEDPACTELRASVEGYLYEALTMGMMEEPMG
jgi:hypothetical protein